MDVFLMPFFIDPTVACQIEKHIRYEIRISLLAKSILKKMHQTFSKQTLAELDKVFSVRGFCPSLKIDEISNASIYELFNREQHTDLDSELVDNAWAYAYRLGMCRVDTSVAH
ncbi:hypothetical protein MO387_11560 [Shewanella sp. N2AIL]|uniref:hypothetical protein n=1 Tax=Shewanella sp. N2AIL TaxID=2926851 RepID=UPI001F55B314|nr:hypothetical protein [Shewanella sp. N2AIL]MCI2963722.1 hypothetical protein [Shewanella sp. N2AIL]